jgi:hemoglobin-like flavoprotein
MSLDVPALRESFALVAERAPHVTTRFYEILFERYPQVRPMFGGQASARQREMLTKALAAVIEHVEDGAWLTETLHGLGARHVDYGVRDEQYGWVGECLLATLEEVAAEAWSPRIAKAWTDAYGAIAGLCIEGASARRAEIRLEGPVSSAKPRTAGAPASRPRVTP